MNKRLLAGTLLGLAVVAAACGSAGAEESSLSPTSMADMVMEMGDASLVRADTIAGADLAHGTFELLNTAPFGFDGLNGSAWLARHDGGTSVTVELDGLLPNSEFIAHVHAGPCADAGGPHYQFDPDGGTMPPNEIHLRFTSDANGDGLMTAGNSNVVDSDARSLVVHPVSAIDAKLACAEFA